MVTDELVRLLKEKTFARKIEWGDLNDNSYTCTLGGVRVVLIRDRLGVNLEIGETSVPAPIALWWEVGEQVAAGQDAAVTEAIKLLRKL